MHLSLVEREWKINSSKPWKCQRISIANFWDSAHETLSRTDECIS